MSTDMQRALREALKRQAESIAAATAIMRQRAKETAAMWRKYQ